MKRRTAKDFGIHYWEDTLWWVTLKKDINFYLNNSGKLINWDEHVLKFGVEATDKETDLDSKQTVHKVINIYLQRLAKRRKVYKNSVKPVGH